jgi:Lon protease-like protein
MPAKKSEMGRTLLHQSKVAAVAVGRLISTTHTLHAQHNTHNSQESWPKTKTQAQHQARAHVHTHRSSQPSHATAVCHVRRMLNSAAGRARALLGPAGWLACRRARSAAVAQIGPAGPDRPSRPRDKPQSRLVALRCLTRRAPYSWRRSYVTTAAAAARQHHGGFCTASLAKTVSRPLPAPPALIPDRHRRSMMAEEQAAQPYDGICSIFFYNSDAGLGQRIGLHLFEPRYRVMVQRALAEPSRKKQIIFLPNYREYIPAHGDIGFAATITQHRSIHTPGEELPRAEVQLRFDARVMVLFHWVEPESYGLHECTFRRLADEPPPHAVEALRDVLDSSLDARYVVTAQHGFLNVHSDPSDPYNTDNVIGRLSEGMRVTCLEERAGWVRHVGAWGEGGATAQGWSVRRLPGDSWLWLSAEDRGRCVAQALAAALGGGAEGARPAAQVLASSPNAAPQHVLVHTPSMEALASAQGALAALRPHVRWHIDYIVPVLIPPPGGLVTVSSLLESYAAIYTRDGLPPHWLPSPAADSSPPPDAKSAIAALPAGLRAHAFRLTSARAYRRPCLQALRDEYRVDDDRGGGGGKDHLERIEPEHEASLLQPTVAPSKAPLLACIGSVCLRHCVHGASIGISTALLRPGALARDRGGPAGSAPAHRPEGGHRVRHALCPRDRTRERARLP